MTRDQMRLALGRHLDALNRHDVDALIALYADGAVLVSPMFETIRGRAAVRQSFERLFTIYPDYRVEMRDSLFICERDRAAEFSTVTATQSVELFGLPPAGRPIEYHAARLFTFHGGLIVYEQRIYDFGGVLERLDKARLEQELAIASAVQQALLARIAHEGEYFEVVGSSLSCRTIGGDFVEYVDLPGGGLGVGVGDVSGKGPAAALVATMLQGMLSVVAEVCDGPSAALAHLNRSLYRRGIRPRFATLLYSVLTPDGRFLYSNAGHNPPVLLTASGATRLSAGGTLLGVFESAEFPEEAAWLHPGDSVIAFSDGVTDAVSKDGEDFGADRFLSCAHAHRSLPPAELLESLFDAVRTFANGAPPTDDATIVITRFR